MRSRIRYIVCAHLLIAGISLAVQTEYGILPSDRMSQMILSDGGSSLSKSIISDSAGNIENVSGCLSVKWDSESRPSEIIIQNMSVRYRYNGLGDCLNRIKDDQSVKHVPDYNASLRNSLMDVDAEGRADYFLYGRGLSHKVDEVGAIHYFHTDEQGNVLAMTDEGGAVTDQYAYDAYGVVTAREGQTDNAYLFGGGLGVYCEDIDSGLYHMKARYYSAMLKRFLSRDPIGLNGGHNLYVYAAGNPLMYVDPRGWCAEDVSFGSGLVGGFDWINHLLGDALSFLDVFSSPVYGQDFSGGGGGDPVGPDIYTDQREEYTIRNRPPIKGADTVYELLKQVPYESRSRLKKIYNPLSYVAFEIDDDANMNDMIALAKVLHYIHEETGGVLELSGEVGPVDGDYISGGYGPDKRKVVLTPYGRNVMAAIPEYMHHIQYMVLQTEIEGPGFDNKSEWETRADIYRIPETQVDRIEKAKKLYSMIETINNTYDIYPRERQRIEDFSQKVYDLTDMLKYRPNEAYFDTVNTIHDGLPEFSDAMNEYWKQIHEKNNIHDWFWK